MILTGQGHGGRERGGRGQRGAQGRVRGREQAYGEQGEPCRIYKELYYTKDAGENWNYITNYVFDFEWGSSPLADYNQIDIPKDRIWVTRDATNNRH